MPYLGVTVCDKSRVESSTVRVRETDLKRAKEMGLFALILERLEEIGCLHKYHSIFKNLYIFLH